MIELIIIILCLVVGYFIGIKLATTLIVKRLMDKCPEAVEYILTMSRNRKQ